MIISQSDRDKKNFITIGANSNIIHVDSSLKFDALDYGSLAATFSYDENLIKKKENNYLCKHTPKRRGDSF